MDGDTLNTECVAVLAQPHPYAVACKKCGAGNSEWTLCPKPRDAEEPWRAVKDCIARDEMVRRLEDMCEDPHLFGMDERVAMIRKLSDALGITNHR